MSVKIKKKGKCFLSMRDTDLEHNSPLSESQHGCKRAMLEALAKQKTNGHSLLPSVLLLFRFHTTSPIIQISVYKANSI